MKEITIVLTDEQYNRIIRTCSRRKCSRPDYISDCRRISDKYCNRFDWVKGEIRNGKTDESF